MRRTGGNYYRKWSFSVAAACAVCLTGCAGLRLPRIDPSGERIFLPSAAPTATAPPQFPFRYSTGDSQPAYQAPLDAPPCPPGVYPSATPLVVPSNLGQAVKSNPALAPTPSDTTSLRPTVATVGLPRVASTLLLSPERVVAPVGSQVLLRAGINGPNGNLLLGHPVQWILSQESVGHFVAVGGEDQTARRLARRPVPRKLSNGFALGQTAYTPQRITRDTETASDDVSLPAGEAWLTLTSAQEGTSRVTAYAPDMQDIGPRQRIATIHWVDSSWSFPAPVTIRAGQPLTLATTVIRASTQTPAAGTIVRYEIIDGPAAGFAPVGGRAIEVPADSRGVASAQIVPHGTKPGVARIAIQVIQAPNSNDSTRVIVGQGATSITWSAPHLTIRARGLDEVDMESTVTLRVDVSNDGDLAANDVVLSNVIPDGFAFLNSDPPASIFGNRAQWQLGNIPSGAGRVIEFNCEAQKVGEYQYYLRVRSADGETTEGRVPTSVVTPDLKIEMTGPQQANVGEQVQFRIIARNISDRRLKNVVVHDRFDDGLVHAEATSPIKRSLGDMEPNQSIPFAVTFNVTKSGLRCHTLELTADGARPTSQRTCMQAKLVPTQLQGKISVTTSGPKSREIGEIAEFVFEVRNSGNVPLTGVRIVDHFTSSLQPKQATGGRWENGSLVWTIDLLPVGAQVIRRVQCECRDADSQACSRITVTAAQSSLTVADKVCLEIFDEAGRFDEQQDSLQLPFDDRATDEQSEIDQEGELLITVADLSDAVRPSRRVTYILTLVNHRKVSDKNVRLQLEISDGLRLVSIQNDTNIEYEAEGRSYRLNPIMELRAGEKISFRIEAIATKSGRAEVKAKVQSLLTPDPLTITEDTTIFAE